MAEAVVQLFAGDAIADGKPVSVYGIDRMDDCER
jgi:hypothetical protein